MTKKRQTRKSKKQCHSNRLLRFVLKYGLVFVVCLAVAGGLFVYSVYAGLWGKLPSYGELKDIRHAEASVLYTEDGVLIGKYYIENRTNINFTNIPAHTIHALLATEDVRFYQHEGVDKISMLRVFFKTFLFRHKSSGGGSTISQQLAKNLYPRAEQQVTFIPVIKLKEMFTARRLENIYTKDEILALYLNTVSFGENTFGLESAAQQYFSTSASNLSLTQSATLIGMLKGPSYYNPRLHPERALRRRNTVLDQMMKYNFLPEDKGAPLKAEALGLNYRPINHYSGHAPYLREKIRKDALNIIEAYNKEHDTDYNLYRDGLILTTTLNAEMQQYAEEAVRHHMLQLQESYYTHLEGKTPWERKPE
ncbi:MAG: transglycosylase domain-containing protein, partial [Odoribacter sp.]|nr:transglycosylase domain-containing protein [Odoribacter sp.]